MTDGFQGSLPGFEYLIDWREGMFCLLCHATDRSLLSRKDEPSRGIGICEPCSYQLGWAWRQLAGEIPPGFPEADLRKVATACVLIARRKEIPKLDAASDDSEQIVKAPTELNGSYEFLLEANPDGTCSVPSLSLESHPDRCTCFHCNPYWENTARAALALLSSIEIRSWPALVEPLYTAYSPRGRLVGVALIKGWTEVPRGLAHPVHLPLVWRPWPLSEHTGEMAGFWRTMETVWSLRLHKHCVAEDAGELCVHLREAACRYIELQAVIRSRQSGAPASVDASMLSVYRAAMSADEVAIERLIQLAENRAKDAKSLIVIPTDATGGRVPSREAPDPDESEDVQEESEDDSREGDDGEQDGPWEEPDDQSDDGDSKGGNDSSFVRPRHPLLQK